MTTPTELCFDELIALGERLARATREPHFGLDAGAELPRGAYGIVEYAAAAAPTLEHALDVLVRCHALNSELARVAIRRDRTLVTFEHWVEHPAGPQAIHGNEFAIAAYASIGARALAKRPPWRSVRFMHRGTPQRASVLARFFGAPVELGAPKNALVFDTALLAEPIATADPVLFEILAAHAQRDVATLPSHDDPAEQARTMYRTLLLDQPRQAQAHDLARALGLSPRGLHRRLAAIGMSFRVIEAQVKHALAIGFLQDRERPIDQVAALVGFNAPSAFIRACRRWTGKTPKELRAAV